MNLRFLNLSWRTAKSYNRNQTVLTNVDGVPTFTNIIATETYYRIKQIDYDGSFEYSNTIVITKEELGQKSLSIFPNPVSDNLNVVNGQGIAKISNILGQIILEKNINQEHSSINVSSLPKGQYILIIQKVNSEVINLQFTK